MTRTAAATLLALLLALPTAPEVHGATGTAPEWEVSEWLNGPGASLESLRGRVVVVDFVHMACPGCRAVSIPLIRRWQQTFAADIAAERLLIVSIHTVFEAHDRQGPEALRAFLEREGIHHLVGVDRHVGDDPIPMTMRRYGNGGTPEMAILDREGQLRFKQFGFVDEVAVEALIRELVAEVALAQRMNRPWRNFR